MKSLFGTFVMILAILVGNAQLNHGPLESSKQEEVVDFTVVQTEGINYFTLLIKNEMSDGLYLLKRTSYSDGETTVIDFKESVTGLADTELMYSFTDKKPLNEELDYQLVKVTNNYTSVIATRTIPGPEGNTPQLVENKGE